MKTEPNDQAYPSFEESEIEGELTRISTGLTKREYFAAMAMQGIVANPSASIDIAARWSVGYADALIKELNKEPDEKTKV